MKIKVRQTSVILVIITIFLVAVAATGIYTLVFNLNHKQVIIYPSDKTLELQLKHKVKEETKKPSTLGKDIPLPKRTSQPVATGSRAPIIGQIRTSQPVVFLTIDDGGTKNANMLGLLQANNIKASLFLANNFIASNYGFFTPFQAAGMTIQNHSVTHTYPVPGTMSYEAQRNEICGMNDIIERVYGVRPGLYRPPGGYYDENTQIAAATCGMRAVVLWSAKANGGSMQYQVGSSLRPGDIVLMHFRPEFADDLNAFIQAKNAAGLTTDYLENWL